MSSYAPTNHTAIIAHEYHRSGLADLPLRTDGTKAPCVKWQVYRWEEIAHWFNRPFPCGIGILCGKRSNGLEVLDFDDPAAYPQWSSRVDAHLLATLPLVATPSDGAHLYYRCETQEASQVLARDAAGGVAIETRAEGAYVVACGSPLAVHEAGKPYDLIRNDPRNPPLITTEQRAALHAAARALNLYAPPPKKASKPRDRTQPKGRQLAGDKFNATASWEEVLEPHGWRIAGSRGGKTYWTKPNGKHGACHATTGYGEADCLYVFSTDAAPFEERQAYNKFAAYALLEFKGDYKRAARAAIQNKHLSMGG